MKRADGLILYKDFNGEGHILKLADEISELYHQGQSVRIQLYQCLHELMEMAMTHGFQGNLWQNYLTYLLVSNENAYSMVCEIRGEVEGSINAVALHDFKIFQKYFKMNWHKLLAEHDEELEVMLDTLCDYQRVQGKNTLFNSRIRDRICTLSEKLEDAESAEEFKQLVTEFYGDFGVGNLGLHKAFRVGEHAEILPITNIAHVNLDDLVGYEIAKQKLIDNTEAFIEGKPANNCLLYGDAGTGKSSSIKAIINQYYDRGLRMIEIYKHQFTDLQSVIAQIKNRNYKFIIYMDDLSFEEFEIEYKYLKAVIEGGLEKKPKNVLIYATSNRRHLIRENFKDKEEIREDMHTSDTVQEKLSLVYRFGVSIYFGAPNKREFQEIVKSLAQKHALEMDEDALLAEANKWELSHGGLSGRTAQQFIDYLLGRKEV